MNVAADRNRPGELQLIRDFPATGLAPRNLSVWLPPGYARSKQRYPVIYAQDGQNLFDPATAFIGVDWGLDLAMGRLLAEGVPPAIIVGIWNTPQRYREYDCEQVFATILSPDEQRGYRQEFGEPLGDSYLDFLVNELKPYIDRTYRTRQELAATFLLGSSMGAIISLYGICRHPEHFGAAACLSTHWPTCRGMFPAYLSGHPLDPSRSRLYFDHGSEGLEAEYRPYQQQVDRLLQRQGYAADSCQSLTFAGADHSERSWRQRADAPLRFLLQPLSMPTGAEP